MRKGESIFKRKDGRFEARYVKKYVNGRAIYGSVYAKNYNECKQKRNNIIISKNIEKIVTKERKKVNDLNNLIDNWLLSKKNILKESSITKYYNTFEEHIKNDIGKIKINKLNSEIVNNYIKDKLKNGKLDKSGGLSNNSVCTIVSILKQVFKENNINIDIIKIKPMIGTGKTLYKEEKINLENYLKNINNNISIGILLSLYLGLRRSEICGLKLSDIDVNNKVININRIVSRVKSFDTKNKTKLILTSPKTSKSKRILPIPDKLFLFLKNIKINNNEDIYLLTKSNKYMDPRVFYHHYKSFLNAININHTLHDLRHTFATDCIELGIDYKSLMELLGHSNVSTTMNVYVHPSLTNKRTFINLL